jgi:hypothetical protein
MLVQEPQQNNFIRRFTFAERMLEVLRDDTVLIMSDEAHFHLTESVNKQHFQYWSANNPQELHQRPLYCEQLTVWCGVARLSVIGPYFFRERGHTVEVNSQCYVTMLREFLLPELRRCHIDLTAAWFQQDGATCHTSRESMALLREHSPGDVEWPLDPQIFRCAITSYGAT